MKVFGIFCFGDGGRFEAQKLVALGDVIDASDDESALIEQLLTPLCECPYPTVPLIPCEHVTKVRSSVGSVKKYF